MSQLLHRYRIIHFFTHHRVAANLLMVLMILAGIWGLKQLNTQFFPTFTLDIASVRITWSGASAEDVERAITIPLEQELRTLTALKEISSTSATSIAALTLEFTEGTDMGNAIDEIKERVARIRNLPSTAEAPEILRIPRYERIARLIISGDASLAELRGLANRSRDELLDRGIAKIDVTGLPKEEIAIEVSSMRLQELGLSTNQLAQKIRQQSQDLPAGFIGKGDVARQLRSLDQQRTATGFAQLPVLSDEQGRLLTVGDIASHIERRALEGEVELFSNGRPTVELLLRRTEGSDALHSARILEQWLEQTQPTLPAHIELTIYDASWKLIEERISLLVRNGLGGLLLVIIILFIFLNARIAFWVTVGIPVSFMATLGILYLMGGSINMISLFALIMAVGIIVDDAIVVAENAQTNFEAGKKPEEASEQGAQRMFAPVTSSSLTTIAAFLPLILVGGTIGNILFHIPLVIICVVIASFVECMLVLPAHMRFSLTAMVRQPTGRLRQRFENGFNIFRDKIFYPMVQRAVLYRGTTIMVTVALLIIAIGLIRGDRIGFTFFPGVDGTIILGNASFTAGTPRDRVNQFLTHLQQSLLKTETELGEKFVNRIVARLGETASGDGQGKRKGDQYGSIIIELTSPDQRAISNAKLIKQWHKHIELPPGIELFNVVQRFGGPPGQDIDIRLLGNDPLIVKQAAAELMEKLRSYPGVSAIEDDLPWGQEQLVYHLTPVGHSLGLTVNDVGQQLRAAFDGARVQIFQDGSDEVEVRVRLQDRERDHLTSLNYFTIIMPNGNAIPLSTVVTLTARRGFEAIRHTDAKLAVRVSADVDRTQNNSNRIINDLTDNYLTDLTQHYLINYTFEGRAADQAATMADMRFGALIGLALIYIILVWVFASYSKPIVIMAVIPFGFIGAIAGHYVMNIELTILSLFGIIGLSGIVVNDSIILISHYQQLRQTGIPVATAIPMAAQARLRAVLLTSLTTIAGLTPLLFETSVQAQFLKPMAISITFGLAFATLLVLIVIPALLSFVESLSTQSKRKFGRHEAPDIPLSSDALR